MGEHNVDASVIKRTQDALGKYVRKPPLTEKLLKKPPFRFLHDVFSVVIRDTGCFVDLYTPEELNFENIKDRDDKMRFLQKMLDVIKLSTGAALTVRTSKIVAGHEPEKTNELLQRMAEVIERKLDWQSAVKQVVAGKPGELDVARSKNPEKAKESSKTRDKTAEHAKVKQKDTTKESKGRDSQAKLAKDSTKHISPTGNEEKPSKKLNGTREKQLSVEKLPTKSKLEKAQREQKESKESKSLKKPKEATEKLKSSSKHKMEVKNKSPSPVKKADTSDTKKTKDTTKGEPKVSPTKLEAKPQNQNSVQAETAIGAAVGGALKQSSIEERQAENQRRSKQATELVTNVVAAVAAESPIKQLDAADDHKSTEKRKGSSSSKGRRSSANKAYREEQQPASLTQQLSSLQLTNQTDSTVNDEAQLKASEQAAMTTPQKQNDTSTSRNVNANVGRAELKRESTFTREERTKNMHNGGGSGTQGGDVIGADSKNNNNAINSAISNAVTNSVPSTNNNNNNSPDNSNKNSHTSSNNNNNNSTGINNTDTTMNGRPRTSLRPPSARPASARPGAPRRRDRNVEIVLQPNDQVKMSGINVKLETFGDFADDDGENLVVIEDANTALNGTDAATHSAAEDTTAHDVDKLEQQGHLVQQILDTQKELVQQNVELTGQGDKKDATGSAGSGGSTRHSSARHMDNLRDVIQNLTKSVNPFGKLMDFIPEDIDAMQLELSMWRDSYLQAANELKRERSLTESTTEPMKLQLVQIEANIKEYMEMIDASRIKILQNSDKNVRMLTEQ